MYFFILKSLEIFFYNITIEEKEERRSPFKVGVNGMPVRPTHDDMAT